eukprot:CAMPEP_0202452802 /NCGR_PEP_ID=MMETSP1360-20130828/10916_1 /ASSEMBLY_ACC=CAM_ASM_000848 /TAXON_ID=515479 /ORGANISM="Licmophora paradoxa, Strain CCMP2313" /LENGTH=150 /DNA_ID=CAMNT_0049071719 /DNA_START=16 /DNA_END=465 /DNA_ORIENTATION=+
MSELNIPLSGGGGGGGDDVSVSSRSSLSGSLLDRIRAARGNSGNNENNNNSNNNSNSNAGMSSSTNHTMSASNAPSWTNFGFSRGVDNPEAQEGLLDGSHDDYGYSIDIGQSNDNNINNNNRNSNQQYSMMNYFQTFVIDIYKGFRSIHW